MKPSSTVSKADWRPFGLMSASALIVANMIGAGVFTTSGFSMVSLSREIVMLAWVVAGMIALCGALSYGILANRITESGGEYLFLSRTVHPSVGFVAGWVSLLQGFTGAIAFAAVTFETYALPEAIRPEWYFHGLAPVVAILIFAAVHTWVMRLGVAAQNIVVIIKLGLLFAFLLYAMAMIPVGGWRGLSAVEPERSFSFLAFATSLVYISLSYSGFNAAVYISEEIRDAKRNVPKSMMLATLFVMGIYLCLNFVFIYGPNPDSVRGQQDIAATAAGAIGGNVMEVLVRAIICLALLSSVSSMIIAGPRVYAKMADDGVFPAWFRFGKVGSSEVPGKAIWFQAILACVVVLLTTLQELLGYLAFTLSISAALTATCIFIRPRGSSTPIRFSPLLIFPAIYIVATLGLAVMQVINDYHQTESLLFSKPLIAFLLTVISGVLLYALLRAMKKL